MIIHEGAKDKGLPIRENATVLIPGGKIIGDVPTLALKNRLDAASCYLTSHPKTMCIVCGGQLGENSEAEVMKNYLINKGISEKRIIEEKTSKTTYENMLKARKLLGNEREIYIATNTYHLFRAKGYARLFDFEPRGLSAPTPRQVLIKSWVREYFALIKYFYKTMGR